ncbi:MAG: hypothetical protein JEZ03_12365 [Bacteroidales bacterium]|nr:hypothetical protein [Bacteroidales bacterium]
MKTTAKFILIIALLTTTAQVFSQMSTILTSKPDQISNKHKTFILLNEETGYVMAQKPEKYQVGEAMPLCYFSTEGSINDYLSNGGQRQIIIHDLTASSTGDKYDWILQYDSEENDIFFSRSNYIMNSITSKWNVLVEGESVFFQNIQSKAFMAINNEGDYYPATSRQQASLWKLIYVY